MKLVTMQDFLAIQGPVIFAMLYKGKENEIAIQLGELEVRTEMLNSTNWYSYQLGGDVISMSGTDCSEFDRVCEFVEGKASTPSLPYDPGATRQYISLYDEDQMVLVMEDADIIGMFGTLFQCFPDLATKAFREFKNQG